MKTNHSKINGTIANIILMFAVVLLTLISVNLWLEQSEYKKEIQELKQVIEEEKAKNTVNEDTDLYEETENFIDSLSNGNIMNMLTSTAQKRLETQLKEQGIDYHDSTPLLGTVEIFHVYAVKTSDNTAKSFAIYRTYYDLDNNYDIPSRQQIITMSIKLDWKIENNEYKVDDYEFQLLENSLDDYLKEPIPERSEYDE